MANASSVNETTQNIGNNDDLAAAAADEILISPEIDVMQLLQKKLEETQLRYDEQTKISQLLIFKDEENIIYFGGCTTMINNFAKRLIVQPNDETVDGISVSFNELILMQNKVVYVYASETNKNNFLLNFPTEEECIKVVEGIDLKKREKDMKNPLASLDAFQRTFLIPIINKIQMHDLIKAQLTDIAQNAMDRFTQEQRENYEKAFLETTTESLFKKTDAETIEFFDEEASFADEEIEANDDNLFTSASDGDNGDDRTDGNSRRGNISESDSEIDDPEGGIKKAKRAPKIFDSSEDEMGGSNHSSAELDDEPENEMPKRRGIENVHCGLAPETIIKPPHFKAYLENRKGANRKTLKVFNPNKTLFYKFYYDSFTTNYACSKCRPKKHVFASHKNEEKIVILGKTFHICQPIEVVPNRVRFDKSVVDNEGASLDTTDTTLAVVPLDANHESVDDNAFIDEVSMSEEVNYAALSNQPNIVAAPKKIAFDHWIPNENFMNEVKEILSRFSTKNLSLKFTNRDRALHLVIHDSVLDSINFEENFNQVFAINCGYPNLFNNMVDAFKENKHFDKIFGIKCVYIAIGFDLVCYEPSLENAIKHVKTFIKKLAQTLRVSCTQVSCGYLEPIGSNVKAPPKIVVMTIPFIDSHPSGTLTYKDDIEKLNEEIREYVDQRKAGWLSGYNQVIEIYDWAGETQEFNQCDRQDMDQRYRTLTTALSEKYQIFMKIPQEDDDANL